MRSCSDTGIDPYFSTFFLPDSYDFDVRLDLGRPQ